MTPRPSPLRSVSACALALLLGACSGSSNAPATQAATVETTQFAPALGVDLAQSTRAASGEYVRDLTVGGGAATKAGQTLSVHYTGWLANGSQFDSNEGRAAFNFLLGGGQVIPGWDAGLVGVRVGGVRQLLIPPALGYGEGGYGPIPGNAVLVFKVQVDAAN